MEKQDQFKITFYLQNCEVLAMIKLRTDSGDASEASDHV